MKKYVKNKLKSFLLLSAASTLFLVNTVHANCVRHISNSSKDPWTFTFDATHGEVHFNGLNCPVNGPCIIPPYSTAEIEYIHQRNSNEGYVIITDSLGHSKAAWYQKWLGNDTTCTRDVYHRIKDVVYSDYPIEGDYFIVKRNW